MGHRRRRQHNLSTFAPAPAALAQTRVVAPCPCPSKSHLLPTHRSRLRRHATPSPLHSTRSRSTLLSPKGLGPYTRARLLETCGSGRERGQHYVRDGGREREGGSVTIGGQGCVTIYSRPVFTFALWFNPATKTRPICTIGS